MDSTRSHCWCNGWIGSLLLSEPYGCLLKGLESGFLQCPLLFPEHLRNGANSGIESVSSSLPPVLRRRAEGVGNFVIAARREKQCCSSSSSSPLSHYTYQEDAAEALVASSSCFSFLSSSLSRLSGEALCLFTLPQPHTWAPSQWDNWLSRTRRGEAHNREEGEMRELREAEIWVLKY